MGADNPKKKGCIACGRSDVPMTKEHFFPQWLIARAEAFHEGIEWLGREEISPYRATIPLCGECNADFGREIEGPMSRVFGDIEAGRGISDAEAELIVRWMWKFEGLAWMFHNPRHIYTTKYTLRERVLQPIDRVRGLLVLAVSLAQRRDPDFRDGTLGMDSANILNAIFVSAVFSRVALIVSLCDFADRIPREVSLYRLAPKRWFPGYQAKLFFPETGFATCTEAVTATKSVSPGLIMLHEVHGPELMARGLRALREKEEQRVAHGRQKAGAFKQL